MVIAFNRLAGVHTTKKKATEKNSATLYIDPLI